jgi:hypothetical protein
MAFSAPCLHWTTNGRHRPFGKSVFHTAAVKFTMDIFLGVLALASIRGVIESDGGVETMKVPSELG